MFCNRPMSGPIRGPTYRPLLTLRDLPQLTLGGIDVLNGTTFEGGSHTRNLEQRGMAAVEEFLTAVETRLPERTSGSAVTPPQAP
jgi:hypothetical protein